MTKQIVVKFDAPDNLRRALSRYRYGKESGLVTKRAVTDWAVRLIEQASLDLQLKLSKELSAANDRDIRAGLPLLKDGQ